MHDKLVALITGANQGIGLQIAKDLAAHGYTVVVGSRNLQNGEKAAQTIGTAAHAVQLDVTKPDSIAAAAAYVRHTFGRLDVLVNNAAIAHAGHPDRSGEEVMLDNRTSVVSLNEVRAVFETNVFGVIAVTQALLPLLREVPAARIVNVSSAMGSLALNSDQTFSFRNWFTLGYGASKTALNAVTMAFAIELENTNIKVNAVSPGFTKTAINNFTGTDTVEQGAQDIVRLALDADGPTGTFVGPEGALPW